MLYVDHFEQRGCEFFDKACELDLEGVVAKRRAVSGNGEALSALDQNQEPELQSGRGPRGIVRAGVNAAGLNASFRGTACCLASRSVTTVIQEYTSFSSTWICVRS